MKPFSIELERGMVAPMELVKQGKYTPATMDAFLLDTEEGTLRPAIIICPGGGYGFVSERESAPIAKKFNSLGFQAFVLNYHVAPFEYPTALCELATAVRKVRENATEWGIDPERIAVSGFSAGGHLAASLCTGYQKEWLLGALDATAEEIAPNACVLCYPVITSGEFGHQGSFENLLGIHTNADKAKKYKQDLLELVSLEKHVTEDTPPTFVWHTYEDASVPVENSLLYVASLCNAGVLAEFHMFPLGIHGLSLATEETAFGDPNCVREECSIWPEMAARFLDQAM